MFAGLFPFFLYILNVHIFYVKCEGHLSLMWEDEFDIKTQYKLTRRKGGNLLRSAVVERGEEMMKDG